LTAIERKPPDRIPVDLRFAPELETRIRKDTGLEGEAFWDWLGWDAVTVRPVYRKPASPVKYADPTIRVERDIYYDIYQVPFRLVDTGNQKYLEPVDRPPLPGEVDTEDIERFPWPSTADWDYSGIEKNIEAAGEKAVWCRTRGPFQTAMFVRGGGQFLEDLLAEPEQAALVLDKIDSFIMEDAEKTLAAGKGAYTFIEYNDDVATQRGMMISPALWREFLKPRLEAFIKMTKSYGVKIRYHSCGSIYSIINDLIEIGIDILSPVQTLALDMNVLNIMEEFGERICLHGGLDIQELLPKGSPEQVKDQVKRLVERGKNGGYILAGTHTLQSDIPTANIAAIVEALGI
jgi:uroporphyrinogen decarboxylase